MIFAQSYQNRFGKNQRRKSNRRRSTRGNANKKSESAIFSRTEKSHHPKAKYWEQKKFLEKEFQM